MNVSSIVVLQLAPFSPSTPTPLICLPIHGLPPWAQFTHTLAFRAQKSLFTCLLCGETVAPLLRMTAGVLLKLLTDRTLRRCFLHRLLAAVAIHGRRRSHHHP